MSVIISYIIPTCNRPQLLVKAVNSALLCGLSSYEIIVIDDGSVSLSAENTLSNQSFPVRLLKSSNSGVSAARNIGFSVCVGKYIAFLDDDDEWIPLQLKRLVDVLESHPQIAFVFADAIIGNPQLGYQSLTALRTGVLQLDHIPGRQLEAGVRWFDRHAFFSELLARNLITIGSWVMRREVFNSIGRFNPLLRRAEDWELYLRLAAGHDIAFDSRGPVVTILSHACTLSSNPDLMKEGFASALCELTTNPVLDKTYRDQAEAALQRHSLGLAYSAYALGDYSKMRKWINIYRSRYGYNSKIAKMLALSILPSRATSLLKAWRNRLSQ